MRQHIFSAATPRRLCLRLALVGKKGPNISVTEVHTYLRSAGALEMAGRWQTRGRLDEPWTQVVH